uniref:non-specific serine/threonine protein kinase n=1 Tax=Plectus sambesii TaxID=2011161 RepID=A0A914W7C2_9BILA
MEVDEGVPLADEQVEVEFGYEIDSATLKQGAEARLFRCTYLGRPAVAKERFEKKYRHPQLDTLLTKERLKAELRALVKCRQLGIDVPTVYFIDSAKNRIIMERIEGELTVRDYIERLRKDQSESFAELLRPLANDIGDMLANLHKANMVHGDLTTSNLLLRNADPSKLVVIDFGLSYAQVTAEDKGVDLYVLEKALLSTHPNTEFLFEIILESYRKSAGKKSAENVIRKLDEIRLRGRKREMIG